MNDLTMNNPYKTKGKIFFIILSVFTLLLTCIGAIWESVETIPEIIDYIDSADLQFIVYDLLYLILYMAFPLSALLFTAYLFFHSKPKATIILAVIIMLLGSWNLFSSLSWYICEIIYYIECGSVNEYLPEVFEVLLDYIEYEPFALVIILTDIISIFVSFLCAICLFIKKIPTKISVIVASVFGLLSQAIYAVGFSMNLLRFNDYYYEYYNAENWLTYLLENEPLQLFNTIFCYHLVPITIFLVIGIFAVVNKIPSVFTKIEKPVSENADAETTNE